MEHTVPMVMAVLPAGYLVSKQWVLSKYKVKVKVLGLWFRESFWTLKPFAEKSIYLFKKYYNLEKWQSMWLLKASDVAILQFFIQGGI